MPTESRILSNIPYTIHNNSNYDITTQETRDIVDVPYFPAQNLVDVSGKLNVYDPPAILYVPFVDDSGNERLFAVITREDARYTFVEFANDARYLHYIFSGNSFPQGRSVSTEGKVSDPYAEETGGECYTFDGRKLYIFGGYCDGRCTNDLWEYDLRTNAWTNINYTSEERTANEAPSKRRKASILKTGDKIWLFGGETDLLTINTLEEEFFVTLNDLWSFDLNTKVWTNYDKNRVLPHRPGHVIHIDGDKVRLYIEGGYNDIGVYEPAAIWTVEFSTDNVTSVPYTAPFTVSHTNVCMMIDGIVHILVGSELYKWDEVTQTFQLVKSGITTINPETKYYWVVEKNEKDYGDQPTMGSVEIQEAKLYMFDDTYVETRTINLPPRGKHIPRINIDNLMTFWFGGLIDTGHFNESTYVMNHITRQVYKYDFPSDQRPTERVFPSLAYDRYRGRVWLFGGFDGSKFYNDLWYFDLGTHTWHKVHDQLENTDEENPTYPQPRQKAGMCVVADGKYLYIIGGYSDVHAFNDFWMYDIEKNEWSQVYTTDNIPWGSQYFIFEWRDRLWFFNGQRLYRYFYRPKQFVAQPFLIPEATADTPKDADADKGSAKIDPNDPNADPLAVFLAQKKYLDTPINVTVVNGRMFVFNPQFHFYVELETREVRNVGRVWNLTKDIIWLDRYYGVMATTLTDYYINVSPMYPLTKNQLPSSWYSGPLNDPIRDAQFFFDHTEEPGKDKWTYIDASGLFKIQKQTLPVDKAELILDQVVSVVGVPGEVPNVDFSNPNDVWNKTIEALAQPYTYTFTPWFLYNKYLPIGYKFMGVQKVFRSARNRRVYAVYKNGNVLKINPVDGTFFVYFTKLWEGSAFGYYEPGNKIYCFGGLRNERDVYLQTGVKSYPIEFSVGSGMQACQYQEKSHSGLLEFDLNMNEMNLGSVENFLREKRMTMVDYTLTRDYLLSKIRKYIEGYATNTIPETIEDVQEKIYTSMQPLIDDLSQFDFVFEGGQRPLGRAYMAYTQIGNKLYIFGGAECYQVSCCHECVTKPYCCAKPGTLINMKAGSNVIDTDVEAKRCFYFDMQNKRWYEISSLPEWRYLASAINSPDGRYVYVVGGFAGEDCSNLKNSILRYDVMLDKWDELKGIPDTFAPRALPTLQWLDDYHLLIMYGFRTKRIVRSEEGCTQIYYIHMPVDDAWIYDTRSHIMYRAFRNLMTPMGLIVKDQFYIDEPTENTVYILSPIPGKNADGDTILEVYKWDLVTGEVEKLDIIPTTEILNDWNGFSYLSQENIENSAAETLQEADNPEDVVLNMADMYIQSLQQTNFRFRYAWVQPYGEYNHKHLFIIGERGEGSGIQFIEELAHGHKEAHLRIWYVDLELPAQNRFLRNIPYEYPLPIAPVAIAYDGKEYLYVIYNKYNIWRLNFKKVLEDPSGSWWSQLPPCLDCNFLGDDRMDPIWDTFFIPPNYLVLLSADGKMARMDTETFTWFLDKRLPPEMPVDDTRLVVATGVEQDEIYMYRHGGMSGKVMNVFERQWDNFFFDMSVCTKVALMFGEILDQHLWPTILRRRRLYTMNHLGHIFYSWLRIDGVYDVEFQLQDFYRVDEIRVYGDYEYLNNWTNTRVWIYHIQYGWVEIEQAYMTAVINEVGWDWDGEYARRYVRQFYAPTGDITYQYSKCPPNYLKIDLVSKFGNPVPVSKVRVYYRNEQKPYNYLTHINKVELITYQEVFNGYDSPTSVTPLQIVHIEPMTPDDNYSNAFGITVKNTGVDPVRNVVAYAWDNKWIQFSMDPSDPNSWTIRDQNNPFEITDELGPGDMITFYIRAVNIDLRPHVKDLVIKGVYTYVG